MVVMWRGDSGTGIKLDTIVTIAEFSIHFVSLNIFILYMSHSQVKPINRKIKYR